MSALMNNFYEFEIILTKPDGQRHRRSIRVRPDVAKSLQPYDLCDDSIIASIVGGKDNSTALIAERARRAFVSKVVNQLTTELLQTIGFTDLHNGYPQGPSDSPLPVKL